jgi:F0F1-type ATP synthase assembly protein I
VARVKSGKIVQKSTNRRWKVHKHPHDANWGRFVGVGFEIAVGVTIGYFVGGWLDRRYGWNNYGTLAGVMLGVAAGMYLLIRDAIRMNKD